MFGVTSIGTVSLTEMRKAHATPQCYQLDAGGEVLMLTVDSITSGNRERATGAGRSAWRG